MTPKPIVSIGLPVYNGENFLRVALHCLLGQTFTDFELIISDNASTDGTQAICKDYAARDPRIRYFRNEKNIGAAPNMNRVFALAVGKYFKWVSHDDLHAPTFVERCVEVLERNPSIVLCHSKTQLIDSNGARISLENYTGGPLTDSGGSTFYLSPVNPPQVLDSSYAYRRFSDMLADPYAGLFVFGLIRSDVLRSTPGQESYVGSETVLVAELALRGRFHLIPEYMFSWRIHVDQVTRQDPMSRQRGHCGTNSRKLSRFKHLTGYCRVLWRVPLPLTERALSHVALVKRYALMLLQRWGCRPTEPPRKRQKILYRDLTVIHHKHWLALKRRHL